MATLSPFRALRPPAALAAQVASPPYDVVSTKEARALAAGNADSFLRVSRPEIDLPEGVDEHSDPVYAKGRENLEELVRRGVLRADPEPRFYVYAQRMGEHRQTGLVACASVDEYDRDVIKKHEKTRADKEDDRVRHIDTLSAHDEPVFLTYRAVPDLDAAIEEVKRAAPEYDLVTPDGVAHQLWVVPPALGARIEQLFRGVPALYVADGHHRSAAASRVHAARRGQPGEHGGFLAVVFPHDQMQILAYNRLVRDPQRRSPDALLEALRQVLDLEPAKDPRPDHPLAFGVYLGGRWWHAHVRKGSFDAADPVKALDCSIAQDQLLEPLFGIRDPRTSKDVDFVGGIRGHQELERRVNEEGWSLALHLFPTRIEQLIAVSDAGKLMPPKSTWFEPKLRSGLFVHGF
ncbi:DUF1015 domain-containing protein [Anaeromyxobacter sp. PSR-1]|uniref:DUF1015 domain-containing protein n=1 Tax=unclassified Anaeromyxobacter TaxID=2620896 RepID=UPI0005DCB291|nr:DUF1015 family protein [Anaeromyxobacter sp. PSR-1]GAO03677.1 hypothetical protein PSR1_02561 [Anaeromyxobacter sp. PSR-1]